MKPPFIEENTPVLRDSSIPIDEKIDYLESWILKAKEEKNKLIKRHDNIEFYGPDSPTEFELEQYGTSGPLSAKEFKKRQWESKLRSLKRKIKNKENTIESLIIKLEKYKKIRRDEERKMGDKIDLWISKNIPNVRKKNKEGYKAVFKIISEHPDPNNCTVTDLLEIIHEKTDPPVGDDRLRQIIPKFRNSLPLK